LGWIPPSCVAGTSSSPANSPGSWGRRRRKSHWSTTAETSGARSTLRELARYAERRREQSAERAKGEHGRLLGIGIAAYVALTGLGPYESALVRLDATGRALLVIGASPHGQGTATALAQIVADELGLEPSDVTVRPGDTALLPFGMGTYASRNAAMAGNAALVATARWQRRRAG